MSYKADIPADWAEQVSLLQRAVRNPDVFRFIVVQYNYFTVVQKISALLRQLDPERPLLQLRCEKEDYYSLIEKLNQHSGFIILENFQYLAKSPDLYTGFNQRRDQISARPIQLICCMPADEQNVRRCKENLRDFWSIRDLLLKFMDQASEQS